MKKLIFIKLCVLLLISTALYAQKPKAVKEEYINFHWKKTKKTVYIPFDLYSNLVIIPMVINGSDTLKFILDTGVGTTILSDPEIAKKLNLKSVRKIRVNGVGMGESITANIVIDVRMSIGEAQANRQSIIFLDTDVLDLSSFVGTKIHGIIGADLFNNLVVTIDYLNRKIELRYPNNYKYRPSKGLQFPITILDNKPYIQGVNLTNKRSTTSDLLLLDSGAGHAFSIEGQTGDTTKFHLSKYQFQLGKGLNGCWQIGLQNHHLGLFDVDQILSSSLFKGGNGVFALLDQFVDDGHHGDIVQHHALIHFFLLHGRQQQTNGAQACCVLGAHGVFHVFGNLVFEAHGGS